MAEAKTKPTEVLLDEFLAASVDVARHADCHAIAEMMQSATGEGPVMWGASIVGFGRTLVSYANGKTAEWMLLGFSPRKSELVLYGVVGDDIEEAALAKLGKHKTGKGCLYVKRLADVDTDVLRALVSRAAKRGAAVAKT